MGGGVSKSVHGGASKMILWTSFTGAWPVRSACKPAVLVTLRTCAAPAAGDFLSVVVAWDVRLQQLSLPGRPLWRWWWARQWEPSSPQIHSRCLPHAAMDVMWGLQASDRERSIIATRSHTHWLRRPLTELVFRPIPIRHTCRKSSITDFTPMYNPRICSWPLSFSKIWLGSMQ